LRRALGAHNWGRVDLVLSGLNIGLNLGNAIVHSGTVAAARQAVLLGMCGIALSAPAGAEPDFEPYKPWVRTCQSPSQGGAGHVDEPCSMSSRKPLHGLPVAPAPATRGSSRILFDELVVDRKRGLSPFGRSHDCQLDEARCIAGDKQAVNIGDFVLTGFDGALTRKRAPKRGRQIGRLALPAAEEPHTTREAILVREDDALELPVRTLEPLDTFLTHSDVVPSGSMEVVRRQGLAVGTHDQICAPDFHPDGKVDGVGSFAVHSDCLVTRLPSVTVRTVKDTAPVKLAQAYDVRQVIHHPRREQELSAPAAPPVAESDFETRSEASRADGVELFEVDTRVARELAAPLTPQLLWLDAIAGQKPVERARRAVARPVGVDEQRATAAAAEDQRGTQAGGTGADDNHFPGSILACHWRQPTLPSYPSERGVSARLWDFRSEPPQLLGADVGHPEDATIADLLKTRGHATGQFGKNHLGDMNKSLPTAHGFDEFFGNLYHGDAEEDREDPDYSIRVSRRSSARAVAA